MLLYGPKTTFITCYAVLQKAIRLGYVRMKRWSDCWLDTIVQMLNFCVPAYSLEELCAYATPQRGQGKAGGI